MMHKSAKRSDLVANKTAVWSADGGMVVKSIDLWDSETDLKTIASVPERARMGSLIE